MTNRKPVLTPPFTDNEDGRVRPPGSTLTKMSSSSSSSLKGSSTSNTKRSRRNVALRLAQDSHRGPLPSDFINKSAQLPSPPNTDSSTSSPDVPAPSPIPSSSASLSFSSSNDLYKNLSSFSFGSAPTSPPPSSSLGGPISNSISPLTPLLFDRTPRPSVSVSKHGHSHLPSSSHFATIPTDYGFAHRLGTDGSSRTSRRDDRHKSNRQPPLPRPPPDNEASTSFVHRRPNDDDFLSETASLHTFGPTGVSSLSSSRSSSRSGNREGEDGEALFSSDAESEIFEDDHGQDFFTHDGGVPPSMTDAELHASRRGSLPMDIPGANLTPTRSSLIDHFGDHEGRDSLTLRRPSRSLDDDLRILNAAGIGYSDTGAGPKSEPLSKADWRTLEAQMHERQVEEEGVSGEDSEEEVSRSPELDLNYIFNLPSALGVVRPKQNSESWDPQSTAASRRPSDTMSYVQRRYSRSSKGGLVFWGSRRPSSASVFTYGSGEDAFERHLRKQDSHFAERKEMWSFKREKADSGGNLEVPQFSGGRRASYSSATPRGSVIGSPGGLGLIPEKGKMKEKTTSPKYMLPGTEEIWRCQHVGRFIMDMQLITHQDPSKPNQHRLNVRHIIDPYNKGNTRGGPTQLVHKHSRAVAYSLYRAYNMYISPGRHGGSRGLATTTTSTTSTGSAGSGGRRSAGQGRKPAVNILLAPKSVQEEYTNTRTTSKLKDYGLLTDTGSSKHGKARGEGNGHKQVPSISKKNAKEKEKREREREKGVLKKAAVGKKQERELEGGEVAGYIRKTRPGEFGSDGILTIDLSSSPPDDNPLSYRVPKLDHQSSLTLLGTGHRPTASDTLSTVTFEYTRSISDQSTIRPGMDSEQELPSATSIGSDDDSDGLPLPTRTPHSEAFNSLDPNLVEYVRNRAENRHIDPPSSSSVFSRFLKRLGPSSSRSSAHFTPGTTPASLEGAYNPAWLTLATRNRVEQHERLLQNLNESFKDVGLLPTRKSSGSAPRKGSRRSSARMDIFEQVPEDSLYMLLPLWPGETDPAAPPADKEYTVQLEERKYLLVYYVPFDNPDDKGKKRRRSKGVQTPSEDSTTGMEKRLGHLSTFRGCARLVGYDEMRGSGIRLPSDGLAVTGSMKDAMQYIPNQNSYHDETVIALCFGKEHGVELIPEGLAKLGLCVPQPESDSEEGEVEQYLTPIGKAAAELTWLGGMALMSFGPD